MTDTADRLAKLADAIYPEPPTTPTQPWRAWNKWRYCIDDMLNIATPGAQLGALVDLLRRKVSPSKAARMLFYAAEQAADQSDPDAMLAALLAAMEEV